MNEDLLQDLRLKLQTRVRRLFSSDWQAFHFGLKQFWQFLQNNPLLAGILEDLEARSIEMDESADAIISGTALGFESEPEHVGVAYFIIKKCVESQNEHIEFSIGSTYRRARQARENLDFFRSHFLEVLYEYIDENIDDRRAMLALLRRYKHRSEWFKRDYLYDLLKADTRKGEKRLALNLYEFLFDQGLNFAIEPNSISGEVDLITAQEGREPLLADVKIFDPDSGKGKSYISRAFNQVYIYTQDYNEPVGYIVIFNVSGKDLEFALDDASQSTPFARHNNKTIFFLTIDIYPHETSASKRGKLQSIVISREDLMADIST